MNENIGCFRSAGGNYNMSEFNNSSLQNNNKNYSANAVNSMQVTSSTPTSDFNASPSTTAPQVPLPSQTQEMPPVKEKKKHKITGWDISSLILAIACIIIELIPIIGTYMALPAALITIVIYATTY